MSISKYIFPFFALFVIFSDELFNSFLLISGIFIESGMKSKEAMLIAGVAYMMMTWDILKNSFSFRNYLQFLTLFIILALYVLTGFLYPHTFIYNNYIAYLLSYGSLSIPAAYVGIRLARGGYEKAMLQLLPLFLIVVSLIVGYVVLFSAFFGFLLNGTGDGFDYQNSSYYLSYCFSYSFFYVFFYHKDNKDKKGLLSTIKYLIVIFLIFFCAVGCILGGGRGAFVYLVLITIYLVYRVIKRSKGKNKIKYFFILGIVGVLMVIIATYFDIFHSVGAERVSKGLTTDVLRMQSWTDALNAFAESPLIGWGIGSIWWTVGFYSHNILTDFLAEMGLVGTTIMLFVIARMVISLLHRSKNSNFDMFLLLLLLGSLVQAAFSGYWISSFKLFLIFGYVFGGYKNKREKNNNSKDTNVIRVGEDI